jgi:hypothetical protein
VTLRWHTEDVRDAAVARAAAAGVHLFDRAVANEPGVKCVRCGLPVTDIVDLSGRCAGFSLLAARKFAGWRQGGGDG